MKTRNPSNPDSAVQNIKSGQEVAKQNLLGHFADSRLSTRRRVSRSHTDYWKSRLFRPAYTRDGQACEVNDLAVRVQHGGRREVFTLSTTNRDAAAVKARDIWTTIRGAGWDAAIARFKPDRDPAPKIDVTLGEFLAAVHDSAGLRQRTFLNYANCLRTITAEVFGIRPPKGTSKFDYRSGGNQQWVGKIDAIKLARLNPDLIAKWQRQRTSRAGNSEVAKARARHTCNTYVRCARSLFSPSIVKMLKKISLPSSLPFDGVELLENGSMKYVSRINTQALIAAAKSDLKEQDPEAYKAFLLALFAGMRKAEIDLAEWNMVDFSEKLIRLQETEWLHLKTQDSAAAITVDEEVIEELRSFMCSATGPFVLESNRPARNDSARPYYRCDSTFDRLNNWLRSKGITSNKPLHELRKEVGAIVATTHGIYAASRYLRHSDITTTARHYADQKQRINVGLGKLLDTSIKAVPQPAIA